jgi:hypothetical protein
MSSTPPEDSRRDDKQIASAHKAVDALEHLSALLRSSADLDRVIDGYLVTRRLLAETFRRLAQSAAAPATSVMEVTRERILSTMRSQYGASFPDDVLFVRSYGETHLLLLSYLWQRVATHVPAERLRVVAGDQVHTERRVRELRDLGFRIRAERVAGESQYILMSTEPDLNEAALLQLRGNLKDSRTLSASQKRELLAVLE